jgi:D-alanyl-D-alanine carboxypeptidase (penicillin-binding protein 5/6)
MKTAALLLALILQTTGLWPRLPASTRDRIATHATTQAASHSEPTHLAVTNLALPIRTTPPSDTPLQFPAGTSALAIDRATGTTLFAQDPTKQRPIASVTKLITILTILSRHNLDEPVTIGQLPSYSSDYVTVGLLPGETYRLGDLVRAALVISANDAADALAIYDSGNLTKFSAQMNIKTASWDITGTRFNNPSGDIDTGNYATADALARIAQLALENPFIRDTVSLSSVSLTSSTGRTLSGVTTNKLLATGRYYGIKTGYTLAAGQCFLGLTRINGHDVITVILGSPDRFGDTEELVNWIGHNYQWL